MIVAAEPVVVVGRARSRLRILCGRCTRIKRERIQFGEYLEGEEGENPHPRVHAEHCAGMQRLEREGMEPQLERLRPHPHTKYNQQ